MVEQAEILEHDADAPPQRGERVLAEHRDVVAEQGDQAAGRPHRKEQEPQQRGLAGAGRAGEELERMRLDPKGEVAQDLRPQPVTQTYVFESDHVALRQPACPVGNRLCHLP